MAMLAATAQAPRFPLGWLTKYQVVDLQEVVQAIDDGRPFLTLMAKQPVTWETMSEAINSGLPDDVKQSRDLVTRFAEFWGRVAHQFLSDDFRTEYNSIKHGLRVRPGGFSISMGVETAPGKPAPPENMRSLGGCEFGSSFRAPVRIDGDQKHHYGIAHRSKNWQPEALAIDMQLIATSIANVISFLRIGAGVDPSTVRFAWPSDDAVFDRYRDYLVGVDTMSTGPGVSPGDIKPFSRREIIELYEKASRPKDSDDTTGTAQHA